MAEDEMVGQHHQVNGLKFEQALGVGDGQGSLVFQSMGSQESDMTEQLNWLTDAFYFFFYLYFILCSEFHPVHGKKKQKQKCQ